MFRAIGMALVWTAPLVLAGCDDGGYYDNRYGGTSYSFCRTLSSCDECTPIYGCGWCTYGNRQGICLSDPSECRTAQFTWTWEPKGCSALEDGGATTPDTGADVSTGDGAEASSDDAPAE